MMDIACLGFRVKYCTTVNQIPVNKGLIGWIGSRTVFGDRGLDLWFSRTLDLHYSLQVLQFLIGFRIWVFQGLGFFRLLVQRCNKAGDFGNLFDEGMVLPDESTRAPGERSGGPFSGRCWNRECYRILRRAVTSSLWPFPIGT